MKTLKILIFIIILLSSAYFLYTYERKIPLTDNQLSSLEKKYYGSTKKVIISQNASEKKIMDEINYLRKQNQLPVLSLDETALILARNHSFLMKKNKRLKFNLSKKYSLEHQKIRAGISDDCFYSLYGNHSIGGVLTQIENKEKPAYLKDRISHMGVGVVHQLFPWQHWVTIVFIERIADIEPFPVNIPIADTKETLYWKLEGGYKDPMIKVTTPQGKVVEFDVAFTIDGEGQEGYSSEIRFRGKGEYSIEILADGPYGIEVAHIMPVYVGIVRKEKIETVFKEREYSSMEGMEREMFKLINKNRSKFKLPPLKYSKKLADVARIHSRDMEEKNETAHDLPGCKNMEERMQDASLKAKKQGENIAYDKTIEAAQQNLMKSPGHRQCILDDDFTHIGIGIVKEETGSLFITQNFAAFIKRINPHQAKKTILQKMNKIRASNRMSPITENFRLSNIAQNHSNKMATKESLQKMENIGEILSSYRIPFRRVQVNIMQTGDIEEIERIRDIKLKHMKEAGIGLTQNKEGTIWVTIILKR